MKNKLNKTKEDKRTTIAKSAGNYIELEQASKITKELILRDEKKYNNVWNVAEY